MDINKGVRRRKRGLAGSLGAVLLIVGVPAAIQISTTGAAGAATPGFHRQHRASL